MEDMEELMGTKKQGALDFSSRADDFANYVMANAKSLDIPVKYAEDMALRCDKLADFVEKKAGIRRDASGRVALTGDDPVKEPGFNPEEIGVEKGGPLEEDADESSYMNDQFTQQENRELRETVEQGDLGSDKTKDDEQAPRPGIQASLDLNKAYLALAKSAGHTSGDLAAALGKMGTAMLTLQANLLSGKADVQKAAKVVEAASRIIPHVASANDETAPKLARMAGIVTKLASA